MTLKSYTHHLMMVQTEVTCTQHHLKVLGRFSAFLILLPGTTSFWSNFTRLEYYFLLKFCLLLLFDKSRLFLYKYKGIIFPVVTYIKELITKILIKYKIITTKYYNFTIYVSVGVCGHFYS